jgi:formylglycine-generating enzyme required for sulfatase activity
MIGNASEWISEWYASPPPSTTGLPSVVAAWGPGYADDWTTNLTSLAGLAVGGWSQGVPAGVLRGGSIDEGTGSGVFSVNLSLAPNTGYTNAGFRCVTPR